MLKNILVAVDGSEFSDKALHFACSLAEKFGAKLHIVHVPQGAAADCVMYLGGAAVTLHASRDEVEQAGKTLIEAVLEVARRCGVPDATTELRAGDPAHEIVCSARARKVDAVVIGSRGLGDLGGLLLGSVSHKVAHTAPCTCITVH